MLKYLKPLYSLTTKVLRAIIWRRKAAALYMVNSVFIFIYLFITLSTFISVGREKAFPLLRLGLFS